MIWFIFAFLLGLAVMLVLWPLARVSSDDSLAARLAYSSALASIESDVSRGLLAPSEAEAARTSAARALLLEKQPLPQDAAALLASNRRKKILSVVVLLVVPVVSLGLYQRLGYGPEKIEAAAQAPTNAPPDMVAAVKKIEDHLRDHPEDGAGFEVLAPVYLRMGRPADAVAAYGSTIRLLGATADRESNLAEAMIMEQNGSVSPEAVQALDKAVALTQNHPKARFYLGIAAEQQGQKDKASQIWQALLKASPPDAPWRRAVEARLAALDAPAKPADSAALSQMSPEQNTMIRQMVAGLAEKLAKDPTQIEGWLRIIRSYVVLQQLDDAKQALEKARAQFAGDSAALARINELAASQGLKP